MAKMKSERDELLEALERIKDDASNPFENQDNIYLWAEAAIAKIKP